MWLIRGTHGHTAPHPLGGPARAGSESGVGGKKWVLVGWLGRWVGGWAVGVCVWMVKSGLVPPICGTVGSRTPYLRVAGHDRIT